MVPKVQILTAFDDEQLTVIVAGLNLALGMSYIPADAESKEDQQAVCTQLLITFRETLSRYPGVGRNWLMKFLLDEARLLDEIDDNRQEVAGLRREQAGLN